MTDTNEMPEDERSGGFTRRDFMKTSALLGGSAALAANVPWFMRFQSPAARARYINPTEEYVLARPENIIYSACQQCNGQCGIKVKIQDGVAVKIDGSPFSPLTMMPHVPYETSPFEMATVDGAICPKGQAGIQASYDPYRVVKVLKRAGPRGSRKWQTISFDDALNEIVNGGKLFAGISGEENREITGLKDLC